MPRTVLEFGTGTGACSFLIALALKENGGGFLTTYDSSAHWPNLADKLSFVPKTPLDKSHSEYLTALAARFALDEQIVFESGDAPPYARTPADIDLLLSDVDHSPESIVNLLAHYLPLMSAAASIFIHGASTYLPSYLLLEKIVAELNAGKVPQTLANATSGPVEDLIAWSQRSNITMVHLTEVGRTDQNSTCWLKIEPVDCMPHPKVKMS